MHDSSLKKVILGVRIFFADAELPTPQQLGTHLRPPDLDPLDFPPPNSQLEFSLHHQVGNPHSPTTEASYGSDNRWSKPYGPDKTESPYGFDNQYGSNPNESGINIRLQWLIMESRI